MDKTEFAGRIEKLCVYLDHKLSSPRAIELWYDDLKFIPSVAWPHIEAQIKRSGWPRGNFPGICKDLYNEWLRLNPAKYTSRTNEGECPDCIDGWLLVEDARQYNYSIPCARCRQEKREKPERYHYLADLIKAGWKPRWQMDKKGRGPVVVKDVRSLAAGTD